MTSNLSCRSQPGGAPGRVTFIEGQGELPAIQVVTPWSTAEIYLLGAHVAQFQKKDEPPLLFLSQCSRFEEGHPIRGGIPVIFPWFGPNEKLGAHGFVRKQNWKLAEIFCAPGGGVSLRFVLPECPDAAAYPPFKLEYLVTVDERLTVELGVTNLSATIPFELENCLHTYFAVGDIGAVSVQGLTGVSYLDNLTGLSKKLESADEIRFSSEVDRVYLDTPHTTEIRDAKLGRLIRVEKENSLSTVVWNPWIAKSKAMPDFGDEEYHDMVCVESGNVKANKIILPPGATSRLNVRLGTAPLP